jgi:hypothetical protein
MKTKLIILYLIGACIYAYFSVTKTMKELSLTPSVDLYANELGFQILVFVVTKGLLLLLGFIFLLYILSLTKKKI